MIIMNFSYPKETMNGKIKIENIQKHLSRELHKQETQFS